MGIEDAIHQIILLTYLDLNLWFTEAKADSWGSLNRWSEWNGRILHERSRLHGRDRQRPWDL